MKAKIVPIALITLGLITGCGQKEEPRESPEEVAMRIGQERDSALQAVEKANSMINQLIREGKFEEAGLFFTSDVIQIISGQPPIEGRSEWIQRQREAAELGEWNLDLEVLNFEYMGDWAMERGRGIQSLEAAEGGPLPSMEMTGDYMVLWKRTPDGWKIQYDYVVIKAPEMAPQ
jgi:ketosteroid isomerase-like protein